MKIRSLTAAMVCMLIALSHSAQIPGSLPISACPSGSVDMCIYNGISGQLVPDNEEETKGAVTVANLNDTDGDLIDDIGDPLILSLLPGQGLNDDIDLIKVVLHPVPAIQGQKVWLKLNKSGSGVRLWRYSDKKELEGGEVKFSTFLDGKPAVEFSPQELPLTLYLETQNHSTAVRDIELVMKYNGMEDVVTATALWVKNTRIWKTREPCPSSPPCIGIENPEAGGSGNARLVGLDAGYLQNLINIDRVSIDGSRYGHGFNSKDSNSDKGFGGRILFEFLIYPTNVDFFSQFNVQFDCTRQRRTRTMKVTHGGTPGNTSSSVVDFPANMDEANDDPSGSVDEDNTPTYVDVSFDGFPKGWRIYSWDRPGITDIEDGQTYAFWATKNTFKEYVRIQINNNFPGYNMNEDGLLGSRASNKIDWHCVYYTKSGPQNLLEPDIQSISFSNPQKSGPGNGICEVEIFSTSINSGYTAYYIPNDTRWGLSSPNVGTIVIADSLPGSNPKKWVLEHSGRIKVTITAEGSNNFGNNSLFKFSVFRTMTGKINNTSNSSFTVDNGF
ncbi:MAG: hypothetical protein IPJ82_07600 [Lewinellaceae bacterium]|nr:hypothetical protein [Lewinellaceae bacterium]